MFNDTIIRIMDRYESSKLPQEIVRTITEMELRTRYNTNTIPFYGRFLTKLKIKWAMKDIDQNHLGKIRLVYFGRMKYQIIVDLIRLILIADHLSNQTMSNICK